MLTDTLLDSSPNREPVLNGRHWMVMAIAAIATFCLAYFGLPLVETPQTKVLITQSLILAAASFLFALMLAYVYADSRHLKLCTWPWMLLTCLLNIAGFIAYLVYSAAKTNNWKRTTLPIAYMIEVIAVGVMIIIPLVYTQALPKASLSLVSIPLPPPPPPRDVASPRMAVHRVSLADLEKAPAVIPKAIATFKHRPVAPSNSLGVVGSLPGGQSDAVIGNMVEMTATPPAPPPPKPQATKRIWRSSQIEEARLIYGPKPSYPQLARMARIEGTVRLEALISTDGTIKDLKVISGHPLLVKAALEAVQQWRYQPTLLNGQPVEVQTEIDVNFTLEQ